MAISLRRRIGYLYSAIVAATLLVALWNPSGRAAVPLLIGLVCVTVVACSVVIARVTRPLATVADLIAESIADGILLLRGSEVLYANRVAERILGLDEGVSAVGLDLEAPRPAARSILLAISQTIPVELAVEQTDVRSHYLIQAYPMPGFHGDTLILAQDVTLVREGQEAKGHFLATLSHEIKTPVTSLTMATRLLARMIGDIPNPTHRYLINSCVLVVERLRYLLEDLLSVSTFDALAQRLEVQSVDLVKLLRNSVQSFQAEALKRGVALSYSSTQAMPKQVLLPMDATKVAWAIACLLTNAIRHTPRGGKVEARLTAPGEGKDWVEIRIQDNGPGIDRARQARIFDKFSSFYDIRVARSGSAGAGLSIAREIVTAHGGRIWLSSEVGRGSEFCFSLPLKGVSGSSASEAPSGQMGMTTSGSNLQEAARYRSQRPL